MNITRQTTTDETEQTEQNVVQAITRAVTCEDCDVWERSTEAEVMSRQVGNNHYTLCAMCADYRRAVGAQTRGSRLPYATPLKRVTKGQVTELLTKESGRMVRKSERVDRVVDGTHLDRAVAEDLLKRFKLIDRR